MGIFDAFKARKKEPYETAAESAAFKEERERRANKKMEERIELARQRGISKATPIHEKIGKGLKSASSSMGSFVSSPGFKGAARVSAGFTGQYAPPRRAKRTVKKSGKKASKKSKGKRSKPKSTRRSYKPYGTPAIFDMI